MQQFILDLKVITLLHTFRHLFKHFYQNFIFFLVFQTHRRHCRYYPCN